MVWLIAKILEKFTLEIVPKLPIQIRTKLFRSVLKFRKIRDKARLDVTNSYPTFEQRLEYALDSRVGLNTSGQSLLTYSESIQFSQIGDAPVNIYKFEPHNPNPSKFAIYFHGGGYFAGSITSHKNFVSKLSEKTNLTIYFFEYRLSPEYLFPSAHDDAKKAVDFISSLNPDKQSIWIGESAGGGLATGLCVDYDYLARPDNLILLSPWLDLSDKEEDKKYLKNRDITIIIDGMHDVGEFYSSEHSSDNPILSPIYADIKSFPDTLIQVCTDELLYNDAIEFTKKLKEKNVNVNLQTWNGLWHAWQFFPIKEANEAINLIVKYVKSSENQSSR